MQPPTRSIIVMLLFALALGAALTSGSADAQQATTTVTITKRVMGTALPGTVFTVRYACDAPVGPWGQHNGTVSFDASGAPASSSTLTADPGTRCSLVEIEAGGASSIDFACSDEPVGSACGEGGDSFTAGDVGGSIAIVVTNVMPALSDVQIRKDVIGPAPPGTVFEVGYTCEVFGELAHELSGSVEFDATGAALSDDTFTTTAGTTCTVTETDGGSAARVSYLCSDIPRGNSCGGLQTSAPAQFTVGALDGEVVVTVQNQMTAIEPLRVQPALTG